MTPQVPFGCSSLFSARGWVSLNHASLHSSVPEAIGSFDQTKRAFQLQPRRTPPQAPYPSLQGIQTQQRGLSDCTIPELTSTLQVISAAQMHAVGGNVSLGPSHGSVWPNIGLVPAESPPLTEPHQPSNGDRQTRRAML